MKNETCTKLLKSLLKPGYTAASYAIRINNEIVAADSVGVIDQIDNKPVTNECTYNVCSISKMFCAMAVMQLVEKGKMNLEDKVYTLLPEFWMPDERYKDITVRMCLDHSSGLPGTQWKHFSLTEVGKVDYYKEVLHYFSKSYLKDDPGAYSVYCNDGFTLAEMVVAKVSGMKYEDYIMENITEPIGAHSTRLSPNINPDYPLVSEMKKPRELLLVQGAGGVTTNMIDLTKFGQLFLEENDIISEKSKEIMRKNWGETFLTGDTSTNTYGLGWDTVCFKDEDYDLGEHVQIKGGNSLIFSSRMIVIPKYNAVLTIAETHDCGLRIHDVIMNMFAIVMKERGIDITNFDFADNTCIEAYEGMYATPTGGIKTIISGPSMVLQQQDAKGKWNAFETLNYEEGKWWNTKNEAYFFEESRGDMYLLYQLKNETMAWGMKVKDHPALSEKWEKRLNKTYIVTSATPYDIAIGNILATFTLKKMEDVEGIMIVEGSYRSKDGFSSGPMRFPFITTDDYKGESFLRTPGNGSRDLIYPWFEEKDGKEIVEVNSYVYMDCEDVEEYKEAIFPTNEVNNVYKLVEELKEVPEVPKDHRIMILNDTYDLVWDSINNEEYTPIKKGWIIFV